ncbi:hypothetical protein GL218_04214 [Daldinia childiae]|uniref:uncharacterized protein n=1 Tax=Daldinia childiae TaxID=326645 RepID=UPI0014471582|nr:uncharacterized protein GL218_04214 [Daldinia childiae]KAF3061973.1 hypothetical protein GL218_04214 [Daldinia childiae]
MERLPEEIIIIIASLLPPIGLAPFATLSRPWQRAIERRTFFRLYIESTDEDLGVFSRIVWPNDMRRRFLQDLIFTAIIDSDEKTVKPSQQLQRFSESLTWHWRQLFCILAEDDDKTGMTLQLGYIESIRDDRGNKRPKYLRSRLVLIGNGENFPIVKCVSNLEFCIDTSAGRVALRTAVNLIKRLPCLRRINIMAEDEEECINNRKMEEVHLEDRHSLANALVNANFLPNTGCREVSLSLEQHDPIMFELQPSWVAPNITNSLSYDPLGAAMRMWSHNLVSLKISGVFDSSLFWPSENEQPGIAVSSWPHLREFHATLGMTTPTGDWYFQSEPDLPNRRNIPCEDTMQPLFAAWAKALGCMPVLEQAAIHFRVNRTAEKFAMHDDPWSVIFQAPDTNTNPILHNWITSLEPYLQNSRFIFQNTRGWRPEEPTMRKLRQLFHDKYLGRAMTELELDSKDDSTILDDLSFTCHVCTHIDP